jgi:hypothetical protein
MHDETFIYIDPRTGKPSTEHQKRVGLWWGSIPGDVVPAKVIPPMQAELDQAERQASTDGLTKRERDAQFNTNIAPTT